MRGHNPDWANLPRRKCDDCGKSYKPKQPLREGTRGFCTDNCRKSYHKHGGAYRKLKVELRKMFAKEMQQFENDTKVYLEQRGREIIQDIVREEIRAELNRVDWPAAIQALSPSPAAQRANR